MKTTPTQYLPCVGSYIKLDARNIGEKLLPGDDFCDSGYPGCEFRFPLSGGGPIKSVAVNVKVTGRTIQYRQGSMWIRVQIEWVGDCEPSTYSGGWMLV